MTDDLHEFKLDYSRESEIRVLVALAEDAETDGDGTADLARTVARSIFAKDRWPDSEFPVNGKVVERCEQFGEAAEGMTFNFPRSAPVPGHDYPNAAVYILRRAGCYEWARMASA